MLLLQWRVSILTISEGCVEQHSKVTIQQVVKNVGALELDVVGSALTATNFLTVWPQQMTEFLCPLSCTSLN